MAKLAMRMRCHVTRW